MTPGSSSSLSYTRYMAPATGRPLMYPIIRFSERNCPESRPRPAGKNQKTEEKPATPKTILVVEDTYENQFLANRFLTSAGYQVDIAENGVIAVDKFNRTKYDLILMDIYMPEMDGFKATEEIRKIEKKQGVKTRIPIIAFTAHAVEGYQEKCLQHDMDDYITKPIKKKDFLKAVESWV